jgi:hypothetical protein
MDEFYGPSARSSWYRIEGEGEPTDYSAGSSAAGDWKGPEPEPIPRPFRVAFDNPPPEPSLPGVVYRSPDHLNRAPVRYPPIDPVTGFRAWLATALRAIDREEPER